MLKANFFLLNINKFDRVEQKIITNTDYYNSCSFMVSKNCLKYIFYVEELFVYI